MNTFLQISIGGITMGCVYALLALIWVIVFRVSHVIFLLAGEFVVVSALVASTLWDRGLGLWLSPLVAILACVVIALLLEGIFRLVPGMSPLSTVLLMIGLTYLIAQVAAMIFGSRPRILPSFLPSSPVVVAGLSVTPHQILLFVVTALIVISLALFMKKTMLGKALAACSEEPEGARLVGINPQSMRGISFVMAALIGGLGGLLLVPIFPISPYSGLSYSLVGFTAAVLGGWSFAASGVAGLILGLLSSYVAGYISSAYQEVFTFGILIAVLVLATLKGAPLFLQERLKG